MLESLQSFTTAFPPLLQWLGVMLIGAVPFVESYFGSVVGILTGVHPLLAVGAASAGNILSMLASVLAASSVRRRLKGNGNEGMESPRRRRLRAAFVRFGVAGANLFGQAILPSQITATALVSFGAPRRAVVLWQLISITLWGAAFGLLAVRGSDLLALTSWSKQWRGG